MRLGKSTVWQRLENTHHLVVTWDLIDTAGYDRETCSEASVAGGVRLENGKWAGISGGRHLPGLLAHGTTVAVGLAALGEQRLKPSVEGKVGSGVYGFELRANEEDVTDTVALRAAWARSISGGYNRGCLIVFRPHGVLIKGRARKEKVPTGSQSNAMTISNSSWGGWFIILRLSNFTALFVIDR